jgi:hypothetical protein
MTDQQLQEVLSQKSSDRQSNIPIQEIWDAFLILQELVELKQRCVPENDML